MILKSTPYGWDYMWAFNIEKTESMMQRDTLYVTVFSEFTHI